MNAQKCATPGSSVSTTSGDFSTLLIDNFSTSNWNAYGQQSSLLSGGSSAWSSGSLQITPNGGAYFSTNLLTCANYGAALPNLQITASIPKGETLQVVIYATNSPCTSLWPGSTAQVTTLKSRSSGSTTYVVPLQTTLFPYGVWAINLQSFSTPKTKTLYNLAFTK